MKTTLVSIALTALCGIASAQGPNLVDAQGNPYPLAPYAMPVVDPYYNDIMAVSPDGQIYAALDSGISTGIYFYKVLDLFLNDIDMLPFNDRVFEVVNNAGVLSITRLSATPGLPAAGVGVGGVGDSMPIFPFFSPAPIPSRPDLLCIHKVVVFELLPTGNSVISRVGSFRVGDGSPGSVSGIVFDDLDADGVRDAGEPGIPGCTVKLVSNDPAAPGAVIATRITDASGRYEFLDLANDDCSVVLELSGSGYQATTPLDVRLANCGCGAQVVDFGKFSVPSQCEGRTPGFWRNNNGIAIIQSGDYWDELRALNLVNATGAAFDPTGNVQQWKSYLQGGNAQNMSYMLSIHLAAMKLNVLSGGVSVSCRVQVGAGTKTIGELIDAANAALALDGFTPPGDPNRSHQEALKNALDAANNNSNWL